MDTNPIHLEMTRSSCHQEWWDCLRSTIVDDLFTGTNGMYYTWSTMCSQLDALTYSPTTMIVTTPTEIDRAFCNDVALDCDSLTVSITSCRSAYSDAPSDLNSCLCNADMLYLGSRCDIDANESCLMRTLDPASVYSNQYCGSVVTVESTSRASLSSGTSASAPEPTSTYVPPTPSSTASAGIETTSASKGTSWLMVGGGSAKLAFAVAVAVLVS